MPGKDKPMSIMDLVEAKEKEQREGGLRLGEKSHEPPIVPLYHYEKRTREFKVGEVYRNFNGSDYRIIDRYKGNRFLLMRTDTGMYLVVSGLYEYMRHPIGQSSKQEYGIEWASGHYLSDRFADIDMGFLREQYGEYVPEKHSVKFFHPEEPAMRR